MSIATTSLSTATFSPEREIGVDQSRIVSLRSVEHVHTISHVGNSEEYSKISGSKERVQIDFIQSNHQYEKRVSY